MGRFLAGVAAALLLVGAGMFWWKGRAEGNGAIPAAPAATAAAGDEVLGDPPQASDKTREEKRFGRYDKDRNGAVTRDEYLLGRHKAYAKLDTNHDGQLSFDEWALKSTTKFAAADADRSGSLTAGEFQATAVKRKPQVHPKCPPVQAQPEDS